MCEIEKKWWSDFYCRLIRSKRGDREESGEGVVDEVPFSFWNPTKILFVFHFFSLGDASVWSCLSRGGYIILAGTGKPVYGYFCYKI